MSIHTKERQASFSKKKIRRQTQDLHKSIIETESDESKRFYYVLQRCCDDRLSPVFSNVRSYIVEEDGQLTLIENFLNERREDPGTTINAYSNKELALKFIECTASNCINIRLFFAFGQTISNFSNLSSLKLDYCNLTSNHIHILQESLNTKRCVSELSLIGNPNDHQNFYRLIHCGLKALILKFCNINEIGLRKMATEYLTCLSELSTLIHLDLSNNMVFDEGCEHIATILRCDRALQSLNLTDCKIRDDGFKMLAACFTTYSLDEKEIIIRRKMRLEHFRLTSKENASTEEILNANRNRTENIGSQKETFTILEETIKTHPFMNDCYQDKGEIFCAGNYSLENLNLGYNHITYAGLNLLLKVLLEQNGSLDKQKGLQRINFEGISAKDQQIEDVKATIKELLFSKRFSIKSRDSNSIKSKTSLRRKRSSDGASVKSGFSGKERHSTFAA